MPCKGLRTTHWQLFPDFNFNVIQAIRDVEPWHNSHFLTRNYTTNGVLEHPYCCGHEEACDPAFDHVSTVLIFILSTFNTVHKIYIDTVDLVTHIHCPYIHYRTIFPCTCLSLSHTMAA